MSDSGHYSIPFGDQPGSLCPEVSFSLLKRDGKAYWGKRWEGKMAPMLAWTIRVERELAKLDRSDLVLAIDIHPALGLIYEFDRRLFGGGPVVHQWDLLDYFGRDAAIQASSLARTYVPIDGTRAPVGQLTDFQAAYTDRGLVFLDFELSWYWSQRLIACQASP